MSDSFPTDQAETCAEYLRALGDPVRLRIVRALQAGAMTVSDLAHLLDADLAKTSHHLRTLYHARLVESAREGRYVYYSLSGEFYSRVKSGGRLDFGCCQFQLPED